MGKDEKKTYKMEVEGLIKRYIERLENHEKKRKVLLNGDDTLHLLYVHGKYPYKDEMPASDYEKTMDLLQIELVKAQYWLQKTGKKVMILFEGRDAAGKGGTIQRFMLNLNERHARVSALDVPTEYEKGQWYFQRYVKKLPSAGEIVFSDRSWYNRAGIEKVMGYCTEDQYKEFMKQVVPFEQLIVESGIMLFKYWLNIDQIEQLRRFRKRQTSEVRAWKLSENDIESIDKWDEYTEAVEKMFKKTCHDDAPLYIVRTDDKKRGRIECIRHFLAHLDYPDKNTELVENIDKNIVFKAKEESI